MKLENVHSPCLEIWIREFKYRDSYFRYDNSREMLHIMNFFRDQFYSVMQRKYVPPKPSYPAILIYDDVQDKFVYERIPEPRKSLFRRFIEWF